MGLACWLQSGMRAKPIESHYLLGSDDGLLLLPVFEIISAVHIAVLQSACIFQVSVEFGQKLNSPRLSSYLR
jgi:hypothetical protein